MEAFLSIFGEAFFYATIRMAAPIILAAVGEVLLERAGIFNLGIEGAMLLGAFTGVLGSSWTGSAVGGLFVAIGFGVVLGAIFGWATITLQATRRLPEPA